MTATLEVTPSLAADASHADRSRWTRELLTAAHAMSCPVERRRLLDEVVVLNCRVADAVAARYRDCGIALEDLQQVAYEGLTKAVSRFDPVLENDLLTFAVPTIRGEVLRHLRDRSWMVRPPRRIQELQGQISATVDDLRGDLGREPSTGEVCERLGIADAEYVEAMAGLGCFSPTSLDRAVEPEGDGTSLGDLLHDDADPFEAAEARCLLGPALSRLSPRARTVLAMRYVDDRSLREIGEELGVGRARVARVLDRALRDLRTALEDNDETTGHCS